jgi:lipopolysaccharide biosynthesis glycosyltransferase
MTRINIALCGDRRVLPGLAVTVRSALENCSSPVSVYILGEGIYPSDENDLRNSWQHPNCERIEFSRISNRSIKDFRSTGYLKSKAAYARYFIPEVFPDIDKCLYLDADLLVCRDITEVFSLNLGENICGAVRDISTRMQPQNPTLKRRLGLNDESNYFNSGVLYLDYDKWRSNNTTKKLVAISKEKFDNLDSQDQDALNIVLETTTSLLDPSWNTSQYEQPFPIQGKIVHLIGPVKPWHARYRFTVFGYGDYYRDVIFKAFSDYASRTEYRNKLANSRISAIGETLYSKIPTMDMISGKIRRMAKQS